MPDFELERSFGGFEIAGVDEVGYGAWAGPVVVAAVILAPDQICPDFLNTVNDSKALSARQREAIYTTFVAHPLWGKWSIADVSVEKINTGNVLHETHIAMANAVTLLPACAVLVDGCHTIPTDLPQQCTPKGDQKSLSIAMASIIAKVTRDRLMQELSLSYPFFQWDKNKGYGTLSHRNAIVDHGLTPHHRINYCHNFMKAKGLL